MSGCQQCTVTTQCHYCKRRSERQSKALQPIAKESGKRAKQNNEYSVMAKEFKAAHPTCQACLIDCTKATEHVHHLAGKIGVLLTDKNNFLAVCMSCHQKIELQPITAKALGLSKSRLNIS